MTGYIYKIICSVTNKSYVGSTINPKTRKADHFNKLKREKHHSIKLQRAFNKHKIDNFDFIIIDEIHEKVKKKLRKKLLEKENYWITKLNSYHNGYNSRKDATPCQFGKFNGMFQKSPPNKGFPNKNRKVIYSYKIETGEVKKYDYLLSVELDGFSSGGVCDCANGKHRKINGFFWFWEGDFNLNKLKEKFFKYYSRNANYGKKRNKEVCEAISKRRIGMKFTKKHKKNLSLAKMNIGNISIIRNDGKIYSSIKSAAKDINCHYTQISHHLRGRGKTVKGYIFQLFK